MTSPHGQDPQQAQRLETAKNENTQTRNEERKEISSYEKDAQSERAERGNRPEGTERGGRPEGAERGNRPEGTERGGRPEGAERGNRPESAERSGRPEGIERIGYSIGEKSSSGNLYVKWQDIYNILSEVNPKFSQITISEGRASVSVSGWGNQRGSDSYSFNQKSGEITKTTLYKDSDKAGKVRGWIYCLHVGNWGGWLTKIIYCLSCLIGTAAAITGYYLWIKRITRKKKNKI